MRSAEEMAKCAGERVRLETRDGKFVATGYVPPFEPAAEMLCWGARFFRLHDDPENPRSLRVYREGLCYSVLATSQTEYEETEDRGCP